MADGTTKKVEDLAVGDMVLMGRVGGTVCIAVCAAVGTGIVCTDVFRGYATAERSLSFICF